MGCLVPSKYFITSGQAVSPTSDLNAFDLALYRAGISEQNMVAVSSVIPDGAEEIPLTQLPMGAVTFCVLSQMRGYDGEVVSAGIAFTKRKDGHGGYVAEGHLHGTADDLRKELTAKMKEMSEIRGVEFGEIGFRIESMEIPKGMYGCVLSSMVFADFR
ncbi:MAG: pyruvoyl-dependent arginine decarboxylase [archaeon]|nr:pyruvoyl-dependent arginine decarboxylase [archaeon]